jgi:YVTN family beta-propeller protein
MLGMAPWAGAVQAALGMGHAIVLNSRDASVSIIDRNKMQEVGRIDVGKEPHHLYPTPDNKHLIVANAVSNDLHYLDPMTGALVQRVRSIDDPYQIAFSPDERWFVTAALRLNRVDLYEHRQGELRVVKRIAVARAPSHLWFSADGRFVFVTLQDSNEIAAIDMATQTLVWRMNVGSLPAGIIMTPDDRHLLVGCMGTDFVEVIDWRAQRSVARLVTGKGAHNFRGLGDKRSLFVTNRVEGSLSRIDMVSMTVHEKIMVPGGPDCVEVTADQKQIWVTARFARQVVVIDWPSRKTLQSIPVGRSPHGIYFHQRAAWV